MGMCVDGKCYCSDGFVGKGCQSKRCPEDCNSNGFCDGESGECLCKQGWVGEKCEDKVCPNSCSGHGVCDTKVGKCNCTGDFKGKDCSVTWKGMTNCTLQSVDYCIAFCHPCYGVSRDNYHTCYIQCNSKCQLDCSSTKAHMASSCDRDLIAEPKCIGDCATSRCANYSKVKA